MFDMLSSKDIAIFSGKIFFWIRDDKWHIGNDNTMDAMVCNVRFWLSTFVSELIINNLAVNCFDTLWYSCLLGDT